MELYSFETQGRHQSNGKDFGPRISVKLRGGGGRKIGGPRTIRDTAGVHYIFTATVC